jgi:hypothetical protein
VRQNAATDGTARITAAVAVGDLGAIARSHSAGVQGVIHSSGVVLDRRELLEWWRMFLTDRDAAVDLEPVATLGDSLGLFLASWAGTAGGDAALDLGPYAKGEIALIEVGAGGDAERVETFAPGRLANAVARVYERYAELLPEGPERERAEATAHAVAIDLLVDDSSYENVIAPDVAFVDHRPLGFGRVRGAASFLRGEAAQSELEGNIGVHVHDILELRPGAFLVRCTTSGTGRLGGGRYERPLLKLCAFTDDGLIARVEWFEPDRDAEALARFDELVAEPPASRFENAATRVTDAFVRSMHARDWAGVVAIHAPDARLIDRRSLVGVDLTGSDVVRNVRVIFDMGVSRWRTDLLATRGERLALYRLFLEIQDAKAGPAVVEYLHLAEVDEGGRVSAIACFDLDAFDAAYAELDARYTTHDPGSARGFEFYRASEARDWDALASFLAPDFVLYDHRPLGWETLRGPQAKVDMHRRLAELAPDARLRIDHLRSTERGSLLTGTLVGTREGGAFKDSKIVVSELDAEGRFRRMDQYGLDQVDAALARFEEVCAAPPKPRFENAATRVTDAFLRAWDSRDWEGIAAVHAPDHRLYDRRSLVGRDLAGRDNLTSLRFIFDLGPSRWRMDLLATRGDRLALYRVLVEVESSDVGPSLVEYLHVVEVDASKRVSAVVTFDPDALDAAYAELDTRYAAGEGARFAALRGFYAEALRAFGTPDPEALERLLPDGFQSVSHGTLRLYPSPMNRAEAVRILSAAREIGMRGQVHCDHLRVSERAFLADLRWVGTRDGADFEIPDLIVGSHDGRVSHTWEVFDPVSQVDRALARFEELSRDSTASPSIGNSATRTVARAREAWTARDLEAFAALLAPEFRGIDRRALARVELGRAEFVASYREILEMTSSPPVGRVIATRGDRLALFRWHWFGSAGAIGTSEIEQLILVENDERGRHRTVVAFDPGALDAAYAELDARYAVGEGREFPRALSLLWELLVVL